MKWPISAPIEPNLKLVLYDLDSSSPECGWDAEEAIATMGDVLVVA